MIFCVTNIQRKYEKSFKMNNKQLFWILQREKKKNSRNSFRFFFFRISYEWKFLNNRLDDAKLI